MAGQSGKSKASHKRAPEETRSRQARRQERGKHRDKQQRQRAEANYHAARLSAHEVRDIMARRERGEELRTIGRAYGLDELTVARVLRYGKLTPWQVAQGKRDAARVPKQQEWAKRHGKKDQLPAS